MEILFSQRLGAQIVSDEELCTTDGLTQGVFRKEAIATDCNM
jgi:hypothetical protein